MTNINCDIIIESQSSWKNYENDIKLRAHEVMQAIIEEHPSLAKTEVMELSLLLTNDQVIQRLNKKFRNIDRPTNVLSFPSNLISWKDLLDFKPPKDYLYLGDIAFSYKKIDDEAINQNKDFFKHFTHLLTHGILHLIGYDHVKEQDAEVMESLEEEILGLFAIKSPYILY